MMTEDTNQSGDVVERMIAQLDTVDGREDLVAEPNEHLRPGSPGEEPQPTWRWFGEVLLRAAQTMEGVRNAG